MSAISDRRRSAIGSGLVTGSSFQAARPCSVTFRICRSEDARSVNWIACLAVQSSYIFVVSRKTCVCVRACVRACHTALHPASEAPAAQPLSKVASSCLSARRFCGFKTPL